MREANQRYQASQREFDLLATSHLEALERIAQDDGELKEYDKVQEFRKRVKQRLDLDLEAGL